LDCRLRKLAGRLSGLSLSGLTGLYGYFLLLADEWVSDDGICIWLIPAEFMDVNYGVPLKQYLLKRVTLLQVHRFASEDVQFTDALVSSSIVCFRKKPPSRDHRVDFTFGGSLNAPRQHRSVALAELRPDSKWNGRAPEEKSSVPTLKLGDIFDIKRGLATGDNSFFILTPDRIRELGLPVQFFKPILPSPRYLEEDEVLADESGNPLIDRRLLLLDCRLPEERVRKEYPALWRYFESGLKTVAKAYLCRSRSPWYSQENRPAPLFLCTYMGRTSRENGAAFRFILNHSIATAANVYLLLYPKGELSEVLHSRPETAKMVWTWLCSLSPDVLKSEGRVYGGGLHKVEPRELGNVPVGEIAWFLGLQSLSANPVQLSLLSDANA
jgi:adenine-specific DNA-methyltransferase